MRGCKSKDKKKIKWESVTAEQVSVPLGYEFLSARQNTTQIEIKVRPHTEPDGCAICHAEVEKYGTRTPSFRDVKQSERTCVLFVQRQQYMCRGSLRHFFGQPLPGIDTKHDMTFRLVEFIRNNPDLTNVKLAAAVGVTDKTVARIHWEHAALIEKRQKAFDIYLALGFDEKHFDGVDHFVMVDLVTGTYITMITGNDPETIRKELEQYANRDRVGLITIDMHYDYSALAKELFPSAAVIYDAFHVLDLLDECREDVRIDAWRLATGEAKSILHDRKHFWSRLNDPGAWDGEQCDLFSEVPSIIDAHNTYKIFLSFWRIARSPREASRLFDLWIELMPKGISEYFDRFVQAIEKRRDGVFMYFATGATAGPTEAVNRNIQAELYKGRRYSDEGVGVRMKVRDEVKRQRQIDSRTSEGDTEEDIMHQRELQLSTGGSLERSEKMRERIANSRAKISAPTSNGAGENRHEGADAAAEELKLLAAEDRVSLDNFTHQEGNGGSDRLSSDAIDPSILFSPKCLSCCAWDAVARKCIESSNCPANQQSPH